MAKVRVHELAKELGVKSKELLTHLQEQGEFVKSASSTIEAPVVRKIRENPPASAKKPEAKAASKDASSTTTKKAPAAKSGATSTPAKPSPAKSTTDAPKPGPAAGSSYEERPRIPETFLRPQEGDSGVCP